MKKYAALEQNYQPQGKTAHAGFTGFGLAKNQRSLEAKRYREKVRSDAYATIRQSSVIEQQLEERLQSLSNNEALPPQLFMDTERDNYSILGVPRTASQENIRTAYHKLALLFHPDKNNNAVATEKLQSINQAYDVLKNPVTRELCDMYLDNIQRPAVPDRH